MYVLVTNIVILLSILSGKVYYRVTIQILGKPAEIMPTLILCKWIYYV